MVVIPAMITNAATIDRLVHRLVLHWLANPERHTQFALLSDWADAATEHAAGDEALLAYAVAQIRLVNVRHPMPGHGAQVPRFILLHRQRTHCRSEQAWIGWERKRGKLEQLLAALATGDRSAFADLGEASLIAAGTRHLVTLDSDTQLPPGRLRELVSVAAHPDNQPRLNAAGTRVVSGYGILQPREHWASQRDMRRSPFWPREKELGATFFDARGWERPQWFASNEHLTKKFPEACAPREHEWDARWWSPITNAEHLQMRESVGMVDLTAFNEFDFTGPGAMAFLQFMCVNNVDVPVGRSVYTPLLTPGGGFRGDLTIMRLAADHFRVITGAFDGGRDKYWFTRHMPTDGSVTFTDMSSALCTIGVWGPNAEKTMAKAVRNLDAEKRLVPTDVSQAAFPYGSVREVLIDGVPCWMFRISYVGENGWEVYTKMEHGLRLWDSIAESGREFGIIPVGMGVYAVTGRIEKGYRLMGAELESEYTPVEAGLARPKVKSADFIGKAAYLKARDEKPVTTMCTLEILDHRNSKGMKRFPTGGNEPILTKDGQRIVDAKGRVSRVTTAGAAPSLGTYLLLAYLPPEHAVEGNELRVMYMNELFPVRVARVGSTPLFDPTDARMKS
jgi:glycine cleavage system aminomethyltransferase T